ncbi:MAG: hypothetical protein RLZZ334_257 [Actinomycetota bacterium]
MKPLKRLVAAGLVVVVFTFSLFLLRSSTSSAPDFERKSSVLGLEEIVVEIPAGASGSSIARILFEAGVIKSSQAYFRIAVADSRSEKVAPGRHRLTLEISAKQALEQLLDPNRIPNLIKVNEGSWKSEIVDALIRYGYSKQEVTQALTNLQLPEGFSDSEGLLFPAQYSFANGTSALTALQSMIDRFTKDPIAGSILKGSNLFKGQQLLTIASIIQAEGDSQDFEKVSRVIYNRLAIDMPLQMDSTVHYVKKVRGEIFLSRNSTLLNSPYNTYRRYGLPPGPIGNPGNEAISAALNPAVGDWLYFITVAPGDTRFTSDISEFNSWKALYTKNRKAGAFN